ncbi:MAG TPA: recombinase family protein [Patescibacteria group bacterium]|nr:recombinase family protein [Patescibacteria group bacterium]
MNDSQQKPLRYFLYARKSSESEERQVQSVEAQIDWGQTMETQRGVTVVRTFIEQRSAKKPNTRPEFAKMLEGLENGEADGILTWQVNRLSRNPIDSGTLQWMLQRKAIQSILTNDREYLPSDNALLLSIDTGMSNQYIRDLAANTWRGMQSKIKKGWFPSLAPHGYLNDKTAEQGERTIMRDPERWDYVRRMWDLMLTGNYNPRQICRIITEEGYRTRPTKRKSAEPLHIGAVYKILNNIFYTGMFEFKGQVYQGAHESMITMSEFDRVQELLGARGKPRAKRYEFSYTGLIRCGECDAVVTAENKVKYVKSTGETRTYTYYRCAKNKRGVSCSQRTIRLEELERQVAYVLADLTISPAFKDFTLHVLQRENQVELDYRAHKHKQLSNVVNGYEKELYDLNKTYSRGFLDDDFYKDEKKTLKEKIIITKNELENSRDTADKWMTMTENVFRFACHAAETFALGDIQTKREIFNALGGKFILKNRTLSFEQEPWFKKISEEYPIIQQQLQEVRSKKITNLYLEMVEIGNILQNWYPGQDSNL